MGNLKLRLSICATGMILLGLCLGIFGPRIAQNAMEEFQPIHLALGAFVYMGLCGVLFYGMLERALNPVLNLTDQFMRMRLGDLDLRLPLEGPEEMQRLAEAFNETIEDLEIQIRDITEEKQAAERGRQFVVEQLEAVGRFKSMVDGAPVGFVLADTDLNIVYQNGISESGFIQLETFLEWNADVVIGRPLSKLFPDEAEAHGILSDPGRLPYEKVFSVGPYEIRFLVGSVYSEEGDDFGLVLLWEVIEAEDVDQVEEVEDELDDLDRMDPMEDLIFEEVNEDEVIEQPLFEEILATESDPETSPGGASLPDREAAVGRNLITSKDQLRRGTALVSRSVRLLSERLSTVRSMV
ncbi:MAG: HAMP domain-containing protein, partial [SAR324 cluster bacterium]|nr:HAMP domain-containing protein [SAR324 cluster bacterium]